MRPRRVILGSPGITPSGVNHRGCGSVPGWRDRRLTVGDPVTAEQMRALFGCGLHPLAGLRLQQLDGTGLTGQDFQDVVRLGAPFKIVDETDAVSGSRWPSASPRSMPRSEGRSTLRSRRLTGPRYGRK